MPKAKNQIDQKEQSRRFIEQARELGVDEDEGAFDRALEKIVPPKHRRSDKGDKKSTPASDLSRFHTCDLQWELDRREGVTSRAIGLHSRVEVLVDGSLWLQHRGPLTVSVNID